MKKVVLFTVICFVFSLLALTSCKKDVEEASPNLKQIDQENVKVLYITNPTDKKKKYDEVWVKIDYEHERETEVNSVQNITYVEHTAPYNTRRVNSSSLIFNTERASKVTKPEKMYSKGDWKYITDIRRNRNSKATMVYEGEYCYIWTYDDENRDSILNDSEIEAFAKKFDVIYREETALCGPKYNGETVYNNVINPNAKISLMLCDIGQDEALGDWYGYFTQNNYFIKEAVRDSNEMEIIFVDSYYAKRGDRGGELFSTIAHEFNHLLNFCNKELKYGLQENIWYTEMLAMLCEDFFEEDLGLDDEHGVKQRLFNGFVKGSYNKGFGNWVNEDVFVSSNYANAYAFGAFLARNYGGARLIHEIMTNEYVNEESVVNAVNKINGTELTFDDLLNDFPLILINTKNQNSNEPSLYKSISEELPDFPDYTYKLKEIDLGDFEGAESSIIKDNPNFASDLLLDSYGFQLYYFSTPTKVSLTKKNFLNHRFLLY